MISLRKQDNREEIWDIVRKKWLVCTPEEWVRQHAISYLLLCQYPPSLISIESGLKTVHRSKRSDALVYKDGKPWLLIECKAPSVAISQKTFNQAFNYNNTLQAPFIYLTNGLQHVFWDCEKQEQLSAPPVF